MSLSITINNINDLTDAERAVLRYVLDGVPMTDELRERRVTLTGPTATQQFIESIAHRGGDDVATTSTFNSAHPELPDTGPLVPAPSLYGPATAAPIPASAELDSAGLPWDKRIHASTRAKLQDGTWRKFRGVDEALVATVEAELRAVQAIPVPAQQVTYVGDGTGVHEMGAAVVPGLNADPSEIPPAGCYPEPVTSVPVPVPPAPTATLAEMQAKLDAVAPPVPPAPTAMTFADLMKHVTPMLVSGKLPQDTLLAVTAEFGLPHLAALGARPDLVEAVRARIDEVVG